MLATACGRLGFQLQGGDGTAASGSDAAIDGTFDQGTDPICGPTLTPTSLAIGRAHVCAVANAQLFCWGANGNGQLGTGDVTERLVPAAVTTAFLPGGVSSRGDHTCALSSGATSGSLYCWGLNSDGQVGDGTTTNRLVPTAIAGTWNGVTAGGNHTCALANSRLSCWGGNQHGQLGLGTMVSQATPAQLANNNWTGVVAGGTYTCGTRTMNLLDYLWCWGANSRGQTGGGDTADQLSPRQATLVDQTYATPGDSHAVAVHAGGNIFVWGANDRGELGLGDTTDRTTPAVMMSVMGGAAAGGAHSCAIDAMRRLWCWGADDRGQLGIGAGGALPELVPHQVGADTDWAIVWAGGDESCATKQDGRLFCWGANESGQLGLGHAFDRDHPVQVCL